MSSVDQLNTYSPWPHRVAVVLCCATLALLGIGALVTTYDAGMAVPDWPTTYGQNMFTYSWYRWLTGPFDLLIEHGHRLMGSLVGMITIAFVVAVFVTRDRGWMRVLSIVALLAVIGQGALGGARVLFDDRQVAMLHGCCGPAFFALTVALAAFTSKWWHQAVATVAALGDQAPAALHWEKVTRISILTAVLAYVQLVLGASIRHIPIDATASYFRGMLVFHLLVAAAVGAHAFLVIRSAWRFPAAANLRRPALLLATLVVVQIGLGLATYVVKYGFPVWFADEIWAAGFVIQTKSLSQALTVTSHVLNGSLILGATVLLSIRSARLVGTLTDPALEHVRRRLNGGHPTTFSVINTAGSSV